MIKLRLLFVVATLALIGVGARAQFNQPLLLGGNPAHIVVVTAAHISAISACNVNNQCTFTPGTNNSIGQAQASLSSGTFGGAWTMPTSGTATNPAGASCPNNSAFFAISPTGLLSSTTASSSQVYSVCIAASQAGLAAPNPYIQLVALNPAGQNCSNPATPSPAQNAGFTTLAACWDFSQAFYATQSNWLDCTNTDATKQWHWGQVGDTSSPLPCNIFQFNDGGVNVMRFQWLPSYSSFAATSNSIYAQTTMNGNLSSPSIAFPNMYIEIVQRGDGVEGINTGSGGGLFTWQSNASPNAVEYDQAEFSRNNDGTMSACGGFSDANIINWGNGQAGGFLFYYGSFGNLPSGYSICSYHKYAMLITSNGSTSTYACSYVDDIFQACGSPSTVAGQYSARNFLILENTGGGAKDGFGDPYPTINQNYYVQYVRVWSCTNWASQQCNGSTLFNVGGVTYWH